MTEGVFQIDDITTYTVVIEVGNYKPKEVEVRVLDIGVHSGMAGGPIPDALCILSRILATLHDEAGSVAGRCKRGGWSEPRL